MTEIDTSYQIIPPGDAAAPQVTVRWPKKPGYQLIKALVEPHLGGEPMEHVTVLCRGKRSDMFVSELGRLQLTTRAPLPRNERATAIYRTNWHPGTDPELLPWIAGPAVLFFRRVWF